MGLANVTQLLSCYTAKDYLLFKSSSLVFPLEEAHKSNKFTPHKNKNNITNFSISRGYESCDSQMRTLFILHNFYSTLTFFSMGAIIQSCVGDFELTSWPSICVTVDELLRGLCPLHMRFFH